MDQKPEDEIVVPVFAEELHADAVPVETGGVRVTKRLETHQEVLEQELRKSRVQVKRVKTNRVVDGPQPVQRSGNTMIIPVVSEILRVEKQWVVTEEIHITQTEERETVQQNVDVSRETPQIERLDAHGDVLSSADPAIDVQPEPAPGKSARPAPASLVSRKESGSESVPNRQRFRSPSLLTKKGP